MSALYDIAAPVAGSFVYLWFRAWRDSRRERRRGQILPPIGPDNNAPFGEMPIVGESCTTDRPP